MPRPPKPVPAYRLHKQSGQAVVTIRTPGGGRRDVLLGKYDSPESRAEYARIVAQLQVAPLNPVPDARGPDLSVNELVLAFWDHAELHYRDASGKPTEELPAYRKSLRTFLALYGHSPAREFGPVALKAVRQRMIADGITRTLINQRIGRIKRVFRWAASEELVPVAVFQALATVAGLQAGRSTAAEKPPVRAVPEHCVRLTLPHVTPAVAAMVEVQLLAGMRPGEACRIRPCDVDRTGPVWTYRPPRHKSAYRGKPRAIAIGPRAQALLAPFWPDVATDHVFSPRRTIAALRAARSAARKTPRWPSHMRRNAAKRMAAPKRAPAESYNPVGYAHAIAAGVEKANEANRRHDVGDDQHGPNLPQVPHWHPNQLRHTHGTLVRRRYGLEAAGAALGHSKMSATEVYAERDGQLAQKIAEDIG